MPESQQGDVYIFDTQFFSLMTSKGYEAVKNWTRKKSILDKKWLVFPIC
jgi:Ulp1 family protease